MSFYIYIKWDMSSRCALSSIRVCSNFDSIRFPARIYLYSIYLYMVYTSLPLWCNSSDWWKWRSSGAHRQIRMRIESAKRISSDIEGTNKLARGKTFALQSPIDKHQFCDILMWVVKNEENSHDFNIRRCANSLRIKKRIKQIIYIFLGFF